MQYVSWKQGDPAIKADPQKIKPKTWTLLTFGKEGSIVMPVVDGLAHLGTYINVADNGGAKNVMVRFIRDPKKTADFTGCTSFDLASGHLFSHMWMILAKRGTGLAVQIYHDGTKPMTISTREFKVAIG
jgi:hypothetical protein